MVARFGSCTNVHNVHTRPTFPISSLILSADPFWATARALNCRTVIAQKFDPIAHIHPTCPFCFGIDDCYRRELAHVTKQEKTSQKRTALAVT